jgi:beta-galactosidase
MQKCGLLVYVFPYSVLSANAATPQHSFELRDGRFRMDRQPFQILSGKVHCARTPRDRWRYAMHMARAIGLNTVTTYVFSNLHEPEPAD